MHATPPPLSLCLSYQVCNFCVYWLLSPAFGLENHELKSISTPSLRGSIDRFISSLRASCIKGPELPSWSLRATTTHLYDPLSLSLSARVTILQRPDIATNHSFSGEDVNKIFFLLSLSCALRAWQPWEGGREIKISLSRPVHHAQCTTQPWPVSLCLLRERDTQQTSLSADLFGAQQQGNLYFSLSLSITHAWSLSGVSSRTLVSAALSRTVGRQSLCAATEIFAARHRHTFLLSLCAATDISLLSHTDLVTMAQAVGQQHNQNNRTSNNMFMPEGKPKSESINIYACLAL
ncbi:hypothetical protein KP509_27G001300 [Ceratopteris richardii]|uniref:Uncharacterized protein n=1 Tax=Ceratopteris richardii TaxID=49495 RepID=A0A8T2REW9_CERRI|nr:hypothetical protein KP509_27G001300 [Ceratopteris richardii]